MINGNTAITKLDLEKRGLLITDPRLDELYQKDLNSPFIQRKMAQATAFLDKHGLPEGWGEWKKQECIKPTSSTPNNVFEQKEQE